MLKEQTSERQQRNLEQAIQEGFVKGVNNNYLRCEYCHDAFQNGDNISVCLTKDNVHGEKKSLYHNECKQELTLGRRARIKDKILNGLGTLIVASATFFVLTLPLKLIDYPSYLKSDAELLKIQQEYEQHCWHKEYINHKGLGISSAVGIDGKMYTSAIFHDKATFIHVGRKQGVTTINYETFKYDTPELQALLQKAVREKVEANKKHNETVWKYMPRSPTIDKRDFWQLLVNKVKEGQPIKTTMEEHILIKEATLR